MEIEDILFIQSGDLFDKDKDYDKINYDQLLKMVLDFFKYSEIGKYYMDIEKYKIFIIYKVLYYYRELKCYNFWYYVIEKLFNSRLFFFIRKVNSYIEFCEDNDYFEVVYKLKNVEVCRDFIYVNRNIF